MNHFLQAEDHNEDNNDATVSPPSTSITQVHTSDQDIYNNNKQALPPGFNYCLTSSPTSATSMWNQWFGLADYKDVPVEGGIPAMENLHKARWRKNNNCKEQKHFSRFKKMITGMSILKLEIDNDGTSFTEMDTLFLEKPKITPFQQKIIQKVRQLENST